MYYSDPATQFFAITKSDSTDLTGVRAIYVGGAGDVAVMGEYDTVATTLTAVPAGTIIPGRLKRVMSTNTTATGIVGMKG